MDEQLNPLDEQDTPKPEAEIVNYEGDGLIVPSTSTWLFDIKDFIRLGLEINPEARKILWNDIVCNFSIVPDGISLEW